MSMKCKIPSFTIPMRALAIFTLLLIFSVVIQTSCATAVERGKGKKIIDNQQKKHSKKYHRNLRKP